jgi:transposase
VLQVSEQAAIKLLHQQGHSLREIARLIGHERSTVRKFALGAIQSARRKRTRKRRADPFLSELEAKLQKHGATAPEILSTLRTLGFTGSLQRLAREYPTLFGRTKLTLLGPSVLSDDHHWMLRLIQGDISSKVLETDVAGQLSTQDCKLLWDTIHTCRRNIRNRGVAMVAHLKGISARAVAQFLMIERSSVRGYIRRFKEGGLSKLFDLSRKKLTKSEDPKFKAAVFTLLHAPPQAHGFNRTTWRMSDLKTILATQGIQIAAINIRKIIRDAGYRYRKARKVLTSNDPKYREKLQAITSILQNLKTNERFFSVDEFGPFAVKLQGGRSLVARGKIKTIPQHQESKGTVIVTAALELTTNQVTHFPSKRKNTAEMLKLLDILMVKYADQSCIYFSWDAASWHASKVLYSRVEEINSDQFRATHRGPIVRLAPLPSCAQFLNVIESVFSGMARAIIHNSDYRSVEHSERAGDKLWGKETVAPCFDEANNCKDPRW